MLLFICQFCGDKKKNKNSLSVHAIYCNKNPNKKVANQQNSRKRKELCKFCKKEFFSVGIRQHIEVCDKNPEVLLNKGRKCPVCDSIFLGNSTTCSYSCSNTYFRHGNIGGARYIHTGDLLDTDKYREICFRFHEKKCIVCGEQNIVEVHHYNEDHSDNRPENLIPLCPTHHKYCHSRHKYLIENEIKEYVARSSNGRTSEFESENLGSTPSRAS